MDFLIEKLKADFHQLVTNRTSQRSSTSNRVPKSYASTVMDTESGSTPAPVVPSPPEAKILHMLELVSTRLDKLEKRLGNSNSSNSRAKVDAERKSRRSSSPDRRQPKSKPSPNSSSNSSTNSSTTSTPTPRPRPRQREEKRKNDRGHGDQRNKTSPDLHARVDSRERERSSSTNSWKYSTSSRGRQSMDSPPPNRASRPSKQVDDGGYERVNRNGRHY